ncbi:MAG: hypothetical protein R8M46_00515 [Ghiorsea sp.]
MMNIKNLLYYNLMTNDNKQATDALAQFNARWKLLVDIHNDLQERFIGRVLVKMNGKDRLIFTHHLNKIETLQKHIFDNVKTVEPTILHQYAFNLKETAILAIKMCKKYKTYDDIKSFKYNTDSKMIELNGEDLYFLGETKKQFEPSVSSLTKKNQICTKCNSNNLMNVSKLHQEELSSPTYTPPRKKPAFFAALLTCVFLGIAWYSFKGSINSSGELSYLDMLVGLTCLLYTVYAIHYNFVKFPSERKQWERSLLCNDCGSISFEKS